MQVKSNVKKSLVSLPIEIADELDDFSVLLQKKKSKIVTEALSMYFDYLDLHIASERIESYESGKSQGLSSSEMRKELGL